MVMLGAVLGSVLWVSMDVPVGLAFVLVVLITAGIGASTEVVAVRPLGRHRLLGALISALAVGVIVPP
jgi:branched-subunit amino acid ABC-type transport system permease component